MFKVTLRLILAALPSEAADRLPLVAALRVSSESKAAVAGAFAGEFMMGLKENP